MKKGLIIATSVIVLALTGCGKNNSNSVSSSEPSVAEEVVTTEGVVDAREEATTEVVEE